MSKIPFDPAEITNAEEITDARGRVTRKFQTPITPKENYRMLYEKKVPYWIPISGDSIGLTPRIDPDNIARCFAFEANNITQEEMADIAINGYKDKFGIEWLYVPTAGGSIVKPGAPTLADANEWKEIIQFPDVDSWDWEGTKASNADHVKGDKWITITILTGFFERLISFMDFMPAAIALIDEDQKAAVHELFDALADVYIQMTDKFIDAYGINSLTLHDDWGSQRAPFFSCETASEMIVPYIKKVADYCHSRGVFFDLHSCGKNEMLVPAYIEAGIDSWSGQPMNDKQFIYDTYGDKLMLGMESGYVAVPGQPASAEEGIAVAKRFIEKYAPNYAEKRVLAGGGFGLPAEFTATLYEESRKAFADK